jgi:cysteine-rich repeat protein
VYFADPSNGWAVGSTINGSNPAGDKKLILRTVNGGTRWTSATPVSAGSGAADKAGGSFYGVWFVDARHGFAVGDNWTVAETKDGGGTWTVQQLGDTSQTGAKTFYAVQFVGSQRGWIVGSGGKIWRTVDGGSSWQEQQSGTVQHLQGISFVNADVGWVVGDGTTILKTTNGGGLWAPNLGTPAVSATNFFDVAFVNENIGIAGTYTGGRLFSTTNGGASWTEQALAAPPLGVAPPLIQAVALVNDSLGWIVGQRGLIQKFTVSPYCDAQTACTAEGSTNAPCQNGDICMAVADASYGVNKTNSCAADCQAPGAYCGDGITQPQYEECDDGNTVATDACNNFCLKPATVAAAAPVVIVGCGDGIVNTGEICDTGRDNGIACTPAYGKSCTYCSQSCTQILTVDPVAFCGNGVVDQAGVNAQGDPAYEVCDTKCDANGEHCGIVTTPSQTTATLCPDLGTMACINSCTQTVSNCVSCGAKTLETGGAVPRIASLNVMTGNVIADLWGRETFAGIHRTAETTVVSNGSNLPIPLVVPGGYSPLISTPARPTVYTQQQTVFGTLGIETNLLCTDAYGIHFDKNSSPYVVSRSNTGRIVAYRSERILGDVFRYPVSGQSGVVDNEFVLSPPIPPGSGKELNLRIVVRWTDEESQRGASFMGNVYSEAFANTDAQSIINLTRAKNDPADHICESVAKGNFPNTTGQYWLPVGCSAYENSVFVHPIGSLDRTFAEAITVYAGAGSVASAASNINANYAFFVQSLDARQPIGRFANSNLTVEVYEYHSGQDTLHSLYRPTAVFSVRNVANTALGATDPYWHAFNIVRTRQADGSERYAIQRFGPGPDGGHGSIEAGFAEVACNIPGHYCPR